MSRRVNLSKTSQRAIEQLPENMRGRTIRAIYQYALTGFGDVKHLSGKSNRWRLRVGDYRVVMEVTPDTIEVLRVGHRREVYRD